MDKQEVTLLLNHIKEIKKVLLQYTVTPTIEQPLPELISSLFNHYQDSILKLERENDLLKDDVQKLNEELIQINFTLYHQENELKKLKRIKE